MNKEKFLEILRKKLSILEEEEIEENLEEYSNFIDEKVKKGATEEEAVKALGNPNTLAKDILSAYKVKSNPKEDTLTNLVNSIVNIFNKIIYVFSKKSGSEIIRFIIEIVFIFIIIAICKIPFDIIESMGNHVFATFSMDTYHVLKNIWSFFLELIYFIFAILLFIKIFESRYFDEEEVIKTSKKEKKENKVSAKKNEKKVEIRPKNNNDYLSKAIILTLKVISVFFLIPAIFFIIGLSFVLGLSLYLIVQKVFYIGAYLIIISLLVLGIIVAIFLANFIFDRKNHIGTMLIISLVSLILLGTGTALFTVEIASTNFIYAESNENNKNEEYLFNMEDNLTILNRYLDNVKIDNSLENKIKVVYSYNDKHLSLEAYPTIINIDKNKLLDMSYHINEYKYNREFFKDIINNLKDKTVYVQSFDEVKITLYTSQDVLNKLKENSKTDKIIENGNLDDICEILDELGLDMPHYCEKYYDEL